MTQESKAAGFSAIERQVTAGPRGRILANAGIWSPDSEWLVYDTRSDAAGSVFDGARIEMISIRTGEVRVLYESKFESHCGVPTFHPREWQVVFIHGPEKPTPDWQYGFTHREGLIVNAWNSAMTRPLDARNVMPPFTPGALRGGSHVHVWDAAGRWVSYTYEDHVLAQFKAVGPDHDMNQRTVAVSVPDLPVRVPATHPRNRDGEYFSVVVARTTSQPRPGSDDIVKACEESWVGANGYVREDGVRQQRALAFQGQVLLADGSIISEVFIADLPDDLTLAGAGPLAGTETRMPSPPKGVVQRRLTFTAHERFPGLNGPRHWLRTSPDGSRIAFLRKDDQGTVQLWTVSPSGGPATQVTHNERSIASAFTWSPDGRFVAHIMDTSVSVTEMATGRTHRLTPPCEPDSAPRPEACVFSPDGRKIAYVRRLPSPEAPSNQIMILELA